MPSLADRGCSNRPRLEGAGISGQEPSHRLPSWLVENGKLIYPADRSDWRSFLPLYRRVSPTVVYSPDRNVGKREEIPDRSRAGDGLQDLGHEMIFFKGALALKAQGYSTDG